MQSLLRTLNRSFSKKLGIAETAKVIQEKIMNITQVVPTSSLRMTSKSSEPSSASATVLPEWLDSIRSRPEKWWSSGQASGAWHSTLKPTMSVWSSSEMTDKSRKATLLPGPAPSSTCQSEKKCWVASLMHSATPSTALAQSRATRGRE